MTMITNSSSVPAQGRELIRKTIHVNEPLRFQGVTFYQASWDITGMRFQINQSPVLQLPLQKLEAQSNGSQVWGGIL
jgi:ResB protein required for cytochrome c biosynthesis